MWNNINGLSNSDDDSWEVRAFEEDTNMGTTWPPRSYTCTFCRREFRSAQALGGHMNVHRRDRARLRQSPPPTISPSYPCSVTTTSAAAASTLIFPTEEFLAAANNGRLCVFYPLSLASNDNNTSHSSTTAAAIFKARFVNGCSSSRTAEISPSPLLSVSNYPTQDILISPTTTTTSTICPPTVSFARVTDQTGEILTFIESHENEDGDNDENENKNSQYNHQTKCNHNNHNNMQFVEELDLELRLGSSRFQGDHYDQLDAYAFRFVVDLKLKLSPPPPSPPPPPPPAPSLSPPPPEPNPKIFNPKPLT